MTKHCLIIIIIVAILTNAVCQEIDDEENVTEVPQCTFALVEKYFEEYGNYITEFEDAYDYLNLRICKIDTITIKKYVVRMINEEKIDSITIKANLKRKSRAVWSLVASDKVWCNEIEIAVEKHWSVSKKKKNYTEYYGDSYILLKRSLNWYYYAMDVYNTEDTAVNKSSRNSVFAVLTKRFNSKINNNPADLMKVESIIYAVLLKDRYSILDFDYYLQARSDLYRNSKQRKSIFNSFQNEYKQYKNHKGSRVVFEYADNALGYLNSLKKLTDYSPPFLIN